MIRNDSYLNGITYVVVFFFKKQSYESFSIDILNN